MPRDPNRLPSYRLHKQSGQAVVTLSDGLGRRRDVLLGPFDSPESHTAYERVVAEWLANGRRLSPAPSTSPASISIGELVLAFWRHAEKHYRYPDGGPTNELSDYKYSLRPLVHLYGSTPASDFGPLALKAVRELMVKGYDHPEYGPQPALSRGVINQRVGRIRRVFKWAVAEELVPVEAYQRLLAVAGLQKGRSDAIEREPVRSVPEDVIAAVQPFLLPQPRAMLEVQLLTGMRPGEVCSMRPCDIDRTGPVWFYRPARHKTAHRGMDRVIPLGPRCQAVLAPFFRVTCQGCRRSARAGLMTGFDGTLCGACRDSGAAVPSLPIASPEGNYYLFSPADAVAELRADQRGRRKTKVQPSQTCRKKAKPRRKPRDRYTPAAYAVAIGRACKKAGVQHFHPHQVRHTHATLVRRQYGLEAAQVLLGHSRADVTQVYAERDLSLAEKVAREIG